MPTSRRRPVWTRLRKGSGGTVTSLSTISAGTAFEGVAVPLVLAGTISGLFISRDDARTWERVTGGLGAPYVLATAVSPNFKADRTLIVGTVDASASMSIDGGVSWRATTSWGTSASVTSVAFSPQFAEDRLAVAGTADSGVIVSNNLGRTWNAQNDGLDDEEVLTVAVSPGPEREERVLAGTASGLYTRARGANTWRLADDCAKGYPIQAIEFVGQADAYTAFAGTEGAGLYRTTTNGLTWHPLPKAGDSATINAIAISPNYVQDGTVIVATAEAGLLRTKDRGDSWHPIGDTVDGRAVITMTVIGPADGWCLVAGLYEDGIWRSDDQGQTWKRSDNGLASRPLISLAASPQFADDATLIAGTAAEGLLRSTDGGHTWMPPTEASNTQTVPAVSFSPDFQQDKRVVAISGDLLAQSTDGGERWKAVAGLPESFQPLCLALSSSSRMAVGGESGKLLLSDDGGTTWRHTTERFQSGRIVSVVYSPRADRDNALFVSVVADGQVRLYHSRDGGATWVRVLEQGAHGSVATIALPPNYRDPKAFLGVIVGRDVFTPNSPRMASWTEGRVSVESRALVTSLVASPRFGRTGRFYAGTGLGLFQSNDRGHTWSHTGGRNAPTGVTCVAVATESSGAESVFAGTLDGDIWRRGRDTTD